MALKEVRLAGSMRWLQRGGDKPALLKTVRASASEELRKALLEEAKLMSKLSHANILNILKPLEATPTSLAFEDCPLGFLDEYIHKHPLQSAQIRKFSLDLCNAMIYLERQGVVHGDIAARNVVVGPGGCKLTNLCAMAGAVDNHEKGTYVTLGGETLLRWGAPEAAGAKRTVQHDVWAFGFFIYELCTQGEVPYTKETWLTDEMYTDTLAELRRGSLLPQPQVCPDELYDIMADCWELLPTDRPSFTRIRTMLMSHADIDELDSLMSAVTAAAIEASGGPASQPAAAVSGSGSDPFTLMEENARLKAELEAMKALLAGGAGPASKSAPVPTPAAAKAPTAKRSVREPHPVGSMRRVKAPVNTQAVVDRLMALFPDLDQMHKDT